MKNFPQLKETYLQQLVVITIFIIFTPITLVASIFTLITLDKQTQDNGDIQTNLQNISTRVLSSSDTNNYPSISSNIVVADARAEILKNYLHNLNSELEPFSDLLVKTADKYNLDYRLLTAISVKESGACRVIPPDSHNCWGWGIHSAGTLTFDSYPEAIETVSKGLKENYLDKGYITPDQIMTKYAHKDSTTWGPDVAAYMQDLE